MKWERDGKLILKFLSDGDIKKIYSGSLYILENVGVKVDHDEGLQMLGEVGAKVDIQKRIVKFPKGLVEQSIKKAPKEFILGARNKKNDLILKYGGELYARPVSGCEGYIDLETGNYRKAQMSDSYEWIRLVDGLENIKLCTGVYPNDVPLKTRDIRVLQAMLENTDKHVSIQPYNKENMKYMIEMLTAVVGSKEELKRRPIMSTICSPISPLQFNKDTLDVLLLAGEYGIPVGIAVMPNAGATGPVTLAGTLQLMSVETLATIVIAELINPGTPVYSDARAAVLEMSRGIGLTGAIENAMLEGAIAQLVHECYGIPTDMRGGGTDALMVDGQSMIERVFSITFSAFSGSNIIGGMGCLETAYTGSSLQLVIDDEICGMCFRALKGIEINDDTLAVDVICKVGHGGNFLANEHTLKYFKTEFFRPSIFNRITRAVWEAEGSKDLKENAKQKAKSILRDRERPVLDDSIMKELGSIVKKAEGKK